MPSLQEQVFPIATKLAVSNNASAVPLGSLLTVHDRNGRYPLFVFKAEVIPSLFLFINDRIYNLELSRQKARDAVLLIILPRSTQGTRKCSWLKALRVNDGNS